MIRTFIPKFMVVIAFLDNPIGVRDSCGDKERDSECRDVKAGSPKTDKDGIEDAKDGESPANALNGDLSARVCKLVEDKAK